MAAFAVVLLAGALLAASLLVETLALVIGRVVPGDSGALSFVDDVLVTLATWGLGIIALAVLFRLLVRKPLAWRHVIVTSAVTVLLLIAGTWALGFYFRVWGTLSLSGAAGSVLVLLIWLYYEAQILIGGAELLRTLDQRDPAAPAR